jgi:hypothetical protein
MWRPGRISACPKDSSSLEKVQEGWENFFASGSGVVNPPLSGRAVS